MSGGMYPSGGEQGQKEQAKNDALGFFVGAIEHCKRPWFVFSLEEWMRSMGIL